MISAATKDGADKLENSKHIRDKQEMIALAEKMYTLALDASLARGRYLHTNEQEKPRPRLLRLLDEFAAIRRNAPPDMLPLSPLSKGWAERVTTRIIWADSFNHSSKEEMTVSCPVVTKQNSSPFISRNTQDTDEAQKIDKVQGGKLPHFHLWL